MTDNVTFFVKLPGTPEQAVVVTTGSGSPVSYPIPDMELPTDQTERFWAIHQFLVANGALPDVDTQYSPA